MQRNSRIYTSSNTAPPAPCLRSGTTVVIDGAGHALCPEQPEAAAEAIPSWAGQFR